MCFKANIPTDGDRHQRHLQIAPAPSDGAIISVFLRRVFNIERLRLWANVLDRHFSLHSDRGTIMRELSVDSLAFRRSHCGRSREPKGECPQWVKVRPQLANDRCPFAPQQQTLIRATAWSASCQFRKWP